MPDRIRASHILVEREPLAYDILSQVKGGGDFAALAKKHSTCPSKHKGGDLGQFGRGAMVKAFEDVAFSLQPGQIGGPAKSEFGFHIIKRTE